MYIYIIIYITYILYILYVHICCVYHIYILIFTSFECLFIECPIWWKNSMRHFFRTVIFQISQIFNGIFLYLYIYICLWLYVTEKFNTIQALKYVCVHITFVHMFLFFWQCWPETQDFKISHISQVPAFIVNMLLITLSK